MTRLQEQINENIFEAIKAFKAKKIDRAKELQLAEHLKPEIEKLISSACQKQKEMCHDEYCRAFDENSNLLVPEDSILNAPLPSEVDRCYTGKEMEESLKIVKMLADWSNKYPRGYQYSSPIMDNELIEIEELAKKFYQRNTE